MATGRWFLGKKHVQVSRVDTKELNRPERGVGDWVHWKDEAGVLSKLWQSPPGLEVGWEDQAPASRLLQSWKCDCSSFDEGYELE